MRIVDAVSDRVESMEQQLRRSLLRWQNKNVSAEPLKPGHRYRDRLSGEELDIASIGRQVEITPLDADARVHWSSPKDEVQLAVDVGILDHNKRRCPACPNTRG